MNFEIAPKSTEIQADWEDAKLYCFSLNIGVNTGWRLPTAGELTRIYESENDFEKKWYWSSNEFYQYNMHYARTWFFRDGEEYNFIIGGGFQYVRAVRTLL